VFDSQTAHLYFVKIVEKSVFFSCTKMRNNGSILVCNRVQSIFSYLACHRKLYCYVKCMKKRQPSVTEPKINPKLSLGLYESVVVIRISLSATIAAVAFAATKATLAMIA